MLCKAAAQFRLLKAFLASTSSTPSVSSFWKIVCMACMAASHPVSWPAHSCREPAAVWMSALVTLRIAFPTIRQMVSHIPMGHTPGFFLRGISWQAMNVARPDGVQIRLVMQGG